MGKKSRKSVISFRVDYAYFSTVPMFSKNNSLDGVFLEVNTSSDWGVPRPNGNDMICDEYGDYVIPFYKCLFSILGFCLPFTSFEIEVLKYMAMTPSQLHPASWAYV